MNEETDVETPLSARLGVLGRIDDALYRVEIVVVVTALVLMSIIVFTDVAYQLAVGVSQYLDAGDSRGPTILAAVLGFIGLIAFAATGDQTVRDPDAEDLGQSVDVPELRNVPALPIRLSVAAATIVGCGVAGWALLTIESSTVFRIVLVALAIPVARTFWARGDRRRLAVFSVAAMVAFFVFGSLPTGYSWSQSYSLIMLLWVGFLGASIAARQRRHLKVDLARKLLPPSKVPLFNCVSYLVAAVFSAVVLYLGVEYVVGADSTYIRPIWDAPAWLPESTRAMLMEDWPLPADSSIVRRGLQVVFVPNEPGELPDWLKVAAIPVSMLLVSLRFLGHAFVFGRMAVRGEEFHEVAGAH